jgi:uncharacterized membrane protein YoaK (UPF0700 family)
VKQKLQSNQASLHLGLMLTLTFSTGIVDAIGYLGLDRVFTANMTGNIVILGMALMGGDKLPVVGPIISLLSFMLGAVIAGRVLRPVASGWTTRSTTLFGLVGVIIVILAIPSLFVGSVLPPVLAYVITGGMALTMGMQAAAARHIAVKDVTTVVITSTLAGLAGDSWFGARAAQHTWRRRAAAVLLIGAGAAVGTLALKVDFALGLFIAAAISIAAAVVGHIGMPAKSAGVTDAELVSR